MRFTNTRLKYFCIALLLLLTAQNKSYAGGFPVRPGSLLLSPSVNYFYANKGWDSLRRLSRFPANGHFSSINFSIYGEYGISRRLTLTAQLPYVINTFEQTGFKSTSTGLTDLEVGLRYYLANIDYKYYFLVQGTGIFPTYTNNPNLGYGETGAELKFIVGVKGRLFNNFYYISLEDGVRQYFGDNGPFQNRYNATFGLTLDKESKNQVSAGIGGFYSKSNFTAFSPTPTLNKNFAFNQVSLSYGHSFSRELSVFITGSKFINGRNTGDGTSGSVALIIRPF